MLWLMEIFYRIIFQYFMSVTVKLSNGNFERTKLLMKIRFKYAYSKSEFDESSPQGAYMLVAFKKLMFIFAKFISSINIVASVPLDSSWARPFFLR